MPHGITQTKHTRLLDVPVLFNPLNNLCYLGKQDAAEATMAALEVILTLLDIHTILCQLFERLVSSNSYAR